MAMGEPTLHEASFSFIPDGAAEAMTSIKWAGGHRGIFTYSDVMSDLKMFIDGCRFFPKGWQLGLQ